MKIINENFVLDRIDRTILRALMKDARTPVLEIGRQVGVSGAAIHQRPKKTRTTSVAHWFSLLSEHRHVRLQNHCICGTRS